MKSNPRRYPPLFITACIMFSMGIVWFCGTLVIQPPPPYYKGCLYISFAVLIFGLGEILNHPKERLIVPEQDDAGPKYHRRRNVCSLGNLCDICALLLFFMGMAALFYPS